MQMWSPALASRQPPRGRRLDLEAWAALPEDEDGELVDGFVAEEEAPDPGLELDLERLWAELARLDANDE